MRSAGPVGVLTVVADVFEQASGVPAALARLGVEITVEPLAAGDYQIGDEILIERKTVPDLHGSLARNRLWAQLGRLRDTAPYSAESGLPTRDLLAADQRVDLVGNHGVDSGPALHRVLRPVTHAHGVVTTARVDRVPSTTTDQEIVPPEPEDRVVAAASIERVRARRAAQHLGLRRSRPRDALRCGGLARLVRRRVQGADL